MDAGEAGLAECKPGAVPTGGVVDPALCIEVILKASDEKPSVCSGAPCGGVDNLSPGETDAALCDETVPEAGEAECIPGSAPAVGDEPGLCTEAFEASCGEPAMCAATSAGDKMVPATAGGGDAALCGETVVDAGEAKLAERNPGCAPTGAGEPAMSKEACEGEPAANAGARSGGNYAPASGSDDSLSGETAVDAGEAEPAACDPCSMPAGGGECAHPRTLR